LLRFAPCFHEALLYSGPPHVCPASLQGTARATNTRIVAEYGGVITAHGLPPARELLRGFDKAIANMSIGWAVRSISILNPPATTVSCAPRSPPAACTRIRMDRAAPASPAAPPPSRPRSPTRPAGPLACQLTRGPAGPVPGATPSRARVCRAGAGAAAPSHATTARRLRQPTPLRQASPSASPATPGRAQQVREAASLNRLERSWGALLRAVDLVRRAR